MRILLVLILVVAAAHADALGAVKIQKKKVTLRSPAGAAVYVIEYPQVVGGAARTNAALKKLFVPNPLPVTDADLERGMKYREERNYAVKLNAAGLLSVWMGGLGIQSINGRMASAHPTKVLGAVTVDVSGRTYDYASLFRRDSNYAAEVNRRMQAIEPNAPQGENGRHTFYLTDRALVITFFDEGFAIASMEVPIPFADLHNVIDPKGPIGRLIAR